MGVEEHLPGGLLLTTLEKAAGWARARSVWPATFGLACCSMEGLAIGGPRHDVARFGMEKMIDRFCLPRAMTKRCQPAAPGGPRPGERRISWRPGISRQPTGVWPAVAGALAGAEVRPPRWRRERPGRPAEVTPTATIWPGRDEPARAAVTPFSPPTGRNSGGTAPRQHPERAGQTGYGCQMS